MFTRYDHIMVAASDLEALRGNLEGLGFRVVQRTDEGAQPAVPQALVCFEDDSYLEVVLYGAADPPARAHRYWDLYQAGAGLVDYSLATDDLATELARAHARGLATEPMKSLRRRRSDGREWEIAFSALGRSVGPPTLPFLIENRTDPAIRAPGGPAREHANGASGICGVTVATPDRHAAAAELGRALDLEFSPAESAAYGPFQVAVFGAGRFLAVLDADSALDVGAHLELFGPGIIEIAVSTSSTTLSAGDGELLAGPVKIRMLRTNTKY
jgi:hypothetical protein